MGDVGSVELGDPDQRAHAQAAKRQGVVKTTLWYRAPELLLGDSRWTFAIDAWSLGCLGVELVQGTPILPATDQVDLLHRIITVFGTPMEGGRPQTVTTRQTCASGFPLSQFPLDMAAGVDAIRTPSVGHTHWIAGYRTSYSHVLCEGRSTGGCISCPPPCGVGEGRYGTRAILGDTWPSGRSRASMAAG